MTVHTFAPTRMQAPRCETRHPAQEYRVGAEPAAVWPGNNRTEDQQRGAEDQNSGAAAKAKEGYEWIESAEQEIRTGRSKKHRQTEHQVAEKSEGVIGTCRNSKGSNDDEILEGAEWADAAAENPPDK